MQRNIFLLLVTLASDLQMRTITFCLVTLRDHSRPRTIVMCSVHQSVVSKLPGRYLVDVHGTAGSGEWKMTLRHANIGLHTAWRQAQNRSDWRTFV